MSPEKWCKRKTILSFVKWSLFKVDIRSFSASTYISYWFHESQPRALVWSNPEKHMPIGGIGQGAIDKTCGFQYFFIFYFHPETWGRFPFWLKCFNWVETTNKMLFGNVWCEYQAGCMFVASEKLPLISQVSFLFHRAMFFFFRKRLIKQDMAFLINLYLRPSFNELSCHLGLRYLVNLKTNPAPSSMAGSVTSTKIAMLGIPRIHCSTKTHINNIKLLCLKGNSFPKKQMFSVSVKFACIFWARFGWTYLDNSL